MMLQEFREPELGGQWAFGADNAIDIEVGGL